MRHLKPWELSNMLTLTRTIGEIRFKRNGTYVDIHIRVNGEETWYAVDSDELMKFLIVSKRKEERYRAFRSDEIILSAKSDGNAEPPSSYNEVASGDDISKLSFEDKKSIIKQVLAGEVPNFVGGRVIITDTIGHFFGKPISTMSRDELLGLVKYLAGEDQKKEKKIQELEDEALKNWGVKL
jgi:hypothetical protein